MVRVQLGEAILTPKKKKNGITFYVSDKEIEQLEKNRPTHADGDLAKRSDRFFAKLIDFSPALVGATLVVFNTNSFTRAALETLFHILSSLVGLCNMALLVIRGQTIGKYFRKIRIVNAKTGALDWANILFLRPLLFFICLAFYLMLVYGGQPLFSLIPISFLLIDVIFIFRKDRRCLHDLIAGSKVIN